ncbi:glycosyltransferase [Marinoscillum pacificum]|uniref:glycosyltransferase n=1 Tax=Marinoscillum pacificum TaxID=392723 RepID=UPI002157BAAD|nr:glycosyltransferase [Marinoscillum pacificum]
MKVLHLNTLTEGGAAKALKRLHLNLLDFGVDSRVLSLYKLPEGESIANWFSLLNEEISLQEKFIRSIKYRVRNWTDPYYEYSSPLSIFRPEETKLIEWADVLNLHWIANFIHYPSFFSHKVVATKPVVWRTPDLFPMRGVVHYDGYINVKNQKLEKSAKELKMNALSVHENINVAATSSWTMREAKKSLIFSKAKSFRLIHNGLNIEKFAESNSLNQAPKNKKQLLFVAARLSNEKKGFLKVIQILNTIKMDGWELLVVGEGEVNYFDAQFAIRYLGNISSEQEMMAIYRDIDIYISAADEEAFGQTIIEAMFCEKPVVAFGVGGILDTVMHEETGLLSELNDIEGFKKNLILLMKNKEMRKDFGRNGRVRAEKFFSAQVQAEKYLQYYKDVLNEKADRKQ